MRAISASDDVSMQALVYDEAGSKLELRGTHPKPEPRPNEALIRVLIAGICSTVGPSVTEVTHVLVRGKPLNNTIALAATVAITSAHTRRRSRRRDDGG